MQQTISEILNGGIIELHENVYLFKKEIIKTKNMIYTSRLSFTICMLLTGIYITASINNFVNWIHLYLYSLFCAITVFKLYHSE